MTLWHRIIFFAFLGFVVISCQPVLSTPATQTPITYAIKITRTPKFTATPSPSATTKPTATNTPTLEPTPEIPPEILAKIATLDAIATEKPELDYNKMCILMNSNCPILSPNGKWAVLDGSENGIGSLNIINIENKKQWNISYYDITGETWGDTYVTIEHWSHDGQYLYVSPLPPGDGGEGWFWRNYIQLIRLNLDNGTWVDTKMGEAYSFSPNDRFIAYHRGQNVVIHEFQTGNERIFTVPTEYIVFGRFTWSSDSKKILFVSSPAEELLSDAISGNPNGFTLFLLNVDDMQVQTILKNDERYLYPIEWLTPTSVLLESLYKIMPDGNLWPNDERYKLDLETNSMSKYESP